MANEFQKSIEEKGIDWSDYVRQHMPEGQPTLDQVASVTEKIIQHKQETKGKIVCLDG